MKAKALSILVIFAYAGAAYAEDVATQIKRLSSAIATSSYGEISRTQSVLLFCDQPGLSKALEPAKARALLQLMEQKKVVWANGDTPDLMNVLSTAMSVSYLQGLTRLAANSTSIGNAYKATLCQSATKTAEGFLSGSSS